MSGSIAHFIKRVAMRRCVSTYESEFQTSGADTDLQFSLIGE